MTDLPADAISAVATPARLPLRDRCRAAGFAALGRCLIAATGLTMRLRVPHENHLVRIRRLGPGPVLVGLWHGHFIPFIRYGRHSDVVVVVSRSRDGEILARILHGEGCTTVRGSSSRGAVASVAELVRKVRDGSDAAIAVDGPRGPRHQAKPGIILASKMTGVPILPVGAAFSRAFAAGSWDRLQIPHPFARVVVCADEPILVPPDADDAAVERYRVDLEAAIGRATAAAEALVRDREAFARLPAFRGMAWTRVGR